MRVNFALTCSRATRICTQSSLEDGYSKRREKHHYLGVDSIVQFQKMGSVDVVAKDKNGKILSDTKKSVWRSSIVYMRYLLKSLASSDATLGQILGYYQLAISNPDNELVYRYEIRDSLASKFSSKKSAVNQLNTSNRQWDLIGELANNGFLKQGHHRGKSAGGLRDAEPAELEKAGSQGFYS